MLDKIEKIRAINSLKPSQGFYKLNRQRLLYAFKALSKMTQGFLLFKGPIEQPIYDDDNEFHSIGEANFTYLFGIEEPCTWGIIDLETEQSTLLVKESDPAKCYWMKIKTLKDFELEFDGDAVRKVESLPEIIGLTHENKAEFPKKLFVMGGVNRETLAKLHVPSKEDIGDLCGGVLKSSDELYNVLVNLRKNKSEEELKLIVNAADINAVVLTALVENYLKEGVSELQLAHYFQAISMYFGAFSPAFIPQIQIRENLTNNFHNSSAFKIAKNGDLVTFETGLNVSGFNSKIIRTFAVSGIFSINQKLIYFKVLRIYEILLEEIKSGFSFLNLKNIVEDKLADLLIDQGVWKSEKNKLIENGEITHFYEEDLIHYIGMDLKEPLSVEFMKGEEVGKQKGKNAYFVKLGVVFNLKVCREMKGVDLVKLGNLYGEVGAIKFGDVILVGDQGLREVCDFYPLQDKAK